MLNIQNYLINRDTLKIPFEKTLEDLKLLGIYTNVHPNYPELIQFSYDQIESPRNHEMVNECRGLILNKNENWDIVAFPFKRFFNYGETCAGPIYWDTARVQEKVDGTLIILYYYDKKWHVATRGSINASGKVGQWDFTFEELFWKTVPYDLIEEQCVPWSTFMFELVSKYNRVVCVYDESKSI